MFFRNNKWVGAPAINKHLPFDFRGINFKVQQDSANTALNFFFWVFEIPHPYAAASSWVGPN